MEKLSLKELLKQNEDKKLEAEVILTEPITKDDVIVGYKLFARVNDNGNKLAEINVSKERYNPDTGKFEINSEQEKFYDEVNKTIFKGKIAEFTGKLGVFKGSSKKGTNEFYYTVYPAQSYTIADKFDDTTAKLSPVDSKNKPTEDPHIGKIVSCELQDGFDLQVFISTDDITRKSDGKPAILVKKIRYMNYDKKSGTYTKNDFEFSKLPFSFEKKIKQQWSDDFYKNDFSSIIGNEIKFYIKNSTFGWYIEVV